MLTISVTALGRNMKRNFSLFELHKNGTGTQKKKESVVAGTPEA